MFKLLVLTALFGLSVALSPAALSKAGGGHRSISHHTAASSHDDAHAEITALHSDVRHDGFEYKLETTNGIHAQESGDDHGNVHGDYEYISPEGEHVKIVYVADENGFQPQGEWIPTPPPIPEAILKSLEYIRTHPPHEEESHHAAPRASARGRH